MKNDAVDQREIQGPPVHSETGLDFQKYILILLKRKFLIGVVSLMVVVAVAAFTFTRTKIYRAATTVIVDSRAPRVLGPQVREVVDLSSGSVWSSRDYMTTQQNVITSKTLALRVAKKIHLESRDDFWPQSSIGLKSSQAKQMPRTLELAAAMLRGSIAVANVKNSRILSISVEHHSPKVAALLANAVADEYRKQNVDYKTHQTSEAREWLSRQLDDLKNQLKVSETALHDFKKTNNIISVSMENKQTLLARRIEKLNEALTDIRMKRMMLDSRRKEHKRALTADPMDVALREVTDNLTVRGLKDSYLSEHRDYAALLQRYLAKHPKVLQQKAKMDMVKAELDREVKSVLTTMDNEYRETRESEGRLGAALQTAKNEALELNKREMAYQRLKRTAQNTEQLVSMVLTRKKESELTGRLTFNNIRSLDPATTPGAPIKPRVAVNLVIGMFIGLMLGIGLAFLVENLDRTVRSQEDVEIIPNLVFFGVVPHIPGSVASKTRSRPDPKPEVDLIVHRNPKSPVSEACRSIRTNLLFAAPDREMKRLLVSSPGPREGKTTTTASLAITMAQAGSRVVVVDTDMRRPRMHKLFGISAATGITTYLSGKGSLDDVLVATEVNNLWLLPCGPTPPSPAELCQADIFKRLLADLDEKFDRVVLDSPPVMAVTDAVVLSTQMDGALLIARTGKTSRVALENSVRQLVDVGSNVVGCVLNDLDPERHRYGYYAYRQYGYARYGTYQYGYGNYGENEDASG